jgi:hypothetical protein
MVLTKKLAFLDEVCKLAAHPKECKCKFCSKIVSGKDVGTKEEVKKES